MHSLLLICAPTRSDHDLHVAAALGRSHQSSWLRMRYWTSKGKSSKLGSRWLALEPEALLLKNMTATIQSPLNYQRYFPSSFFDSMPSLSVRERERERWRERKEKSKSEQRLPLGGCF